MPEELKRELARLDIEMDPGEFLPAGTPIDTEHFIGEACVICRGEVTADNATVVGLFWGPGPNGEGHAWACVPDCALECLALQDKVRLVPGAAYLVTDEHGEPLGVFDGDSITSEGTTFAFALAAVCNDSAAVKRVQRETLTRVGSASFGYVAASALGVLVEHILAPTFEVTRTYGVDLQAGMAAIARGESPGGEGR